MPSWRSAGGASRALRVVGLVVVGVLLLASFAGLLHLQLDAHDGHHGEGAEPCSLCDLALAAYVSPFPPPTAALIGRCSGACHPASRASRLRSRCDVGLPLPRGPPARL